MGAVLLLEDEPSVMGLMFATVRPLGYGLLTAMTAIKVSSGSTKQIAASFAIGLALSGINQARPKWAAIRCRCLMVNRRSKAWMVFVSRMLPSFLI